MSDPRLALLRNADFTRYVAARFLGSLAVQMQTVAVGWQVYEVTRSPLDLGLIGLSQFLPFVLLILPAGHFADTRDRRRILVGCYAVLLLCSLLLWPARGAGLQQCVAGLRHHDAVRRGARLRDAGQPGAAAEPRRARAFRHGGRLQLVAVAGLDDRRTRARRTAVPGRRDDRVRDASPCCSRISLVMLARCDVAARSRRTTAPHRSIATRLLEGLRFVRRRRPVLGAISLDLFAVLFGGATALLPVYAADVLHVGPSGLGWLRAAPGVGAALTGLVLSALSGHAPRRSLDVRRRDPLRARDARVRVLDQLLAFARSR